MHAPRISVVTVGNGVSSFTSSYHCNSPVRLAHSFNSHFTDEETVAQRDTERYNISCPSTFPAIFSPAF